MTRLIDADALLDFIDVGHLRPPTEICFSEVMVKNIIELMPTVEATPARHGKWIYGNEFHWYTASCNQCGYKRYTDIKAAKWNEWKYCPNCGARMDGE